MKKSRKSRKNYSKKKHGKKYYFGRDTIKCDQGDGNEACCSFIFKNPLGVSARREGVLVRHYCEEHCKRIAENKIPPSSINYWHCPERPQWVIDKIKSEELRNSRTQAYETV